MNAISGTTSPNATILYFGNSFGSVQADRSGNYTITVGNGQYELSSYAVGFSFDPATITVTVAGVDVPGQDFIPTALTASSPLDSRTSPNLERAIQDAMIFGVEAQSSRPQPVDCCAVGATVDCRISLPLNSRSWPRAPCGGASSVFNPR